jgi:hypothetical protein
MPAKVYFVLANEFKQRFLGAPANEQVLRFMSRIYHFFFLRTQETTAHLMHTVAQVFDVDTYREAFVQYDGHISFCVRDANIQLSVRQIRCAVRTVSYPGFLAKKFFQQYANGQPFLSASFRLYIRRQRRVIQAG